MCFYLVTGGMHQTIDHRWRVIAHSWYWEIWQQDEHDDNLYHLIPGKWRSCTKAKEHILNTYYGGKWA